MSYEFLQQYWWFVVSLLGGLLVFLLFVQGGNSLLLNLPKDETQRQMMIHWTQVGVYLHHTGYVWWRVFRFIPIVLQHQLWRCLLGMDAAAVHFRGAGCEL